MMRKTATVVYNLLLFWVLLEDTSAFTNNNLPQCLSPPQSTLPYTLQPQPQQRLQQLQLLHNPPRMTTSTQRSMTSDSSSRSSSSKDNDNQKDTTDTTNSNNNKEDHSADDDEYDVIVLYPHSDVPFYLSETATGEAAFAGYVQYQEPVSTIRNVGDVVLSIDGEACQGASIQSVVKIFQEKARTTAYSFVRFRSSMTSSSSSSSDSNNGKNGNQLQPGQLPGERRRHLLEREIEQIELQVETKLEEISNLQQSLAAKEEEIRVLDKRDLEWIEQKRQALAKQDAKKQHDVLPGNSLSDGNNNNNNSNNTNNGSQYYAAEENVDPNASSSSSSSSSAPGGSSSSSGWKL